MGLHDLALRKLNGLLDGRSPDEHVLLHALHLLAKYRATLIANTWIQMFGKIVGSGPFQGLELTGNTTEGCYVPKLIGCYESELHPPIWEGPSWAQQTKATP